MQTSNKKNAATCVWHKSFWCKLSEVALKNTGEPVGVCAPYQKKKSNPKTKRRSLTAKLRARTSAEVFFFVLLHGNRFHRNVPSAAAAAAAEHNKASRASCTVSNQWSRACAVQTTSKYFQNSLSLTCPQPLHSLPLALWRKKNDLQRRVQHRHLVVKMRKHMSAIWWAGCLFYWEPVFFAEFFFFQQCRRLEC